MNEYDLIIIGGGPGGLTAALYAVRANLNTLLLDKGVLGGQIFNTDMIENYPGFPAGVKGQKLASLYEAQIQKYGIKIELEEVAVLDKKENDFYVKTVEDEEYTSKAVILAIGSSPNKLKVPGEIEFAGKGVSYCAVCDANFFKGLTVSVAGGGNAALDEGLYLTKFVEKLYIIHRRDQFRGDKIFQQRAQENPRVEFVLNSIVKKIYGDTLMKGIEIENVKTGKISQLPCDGLFIYIGSSPNLDFINLPVKTDPLGHIITNELMETNVKGLYAIGDVRNTPLRQIVTANADGAIAAHFADKYIESIKFELSESSR